MTNEEIKDLALELARSLCETLVVFNNLNANRSITELEKHSIGLAGCHEFYFTILLEVMVRISIPDRKEMIDFLRTQLDKIEVMQKD